MTANGLVSFDIDLEGKRIPDGCLVEAFTILCDATGEKQLIFESTADLHDNSTITLWAPRKNEEKHIAVRLGYDARNTTVFIGRIIERELAVTDTKRCIRVTALETAGRERPVVEKPVVATIETNVVEAALSEPGGHGNVTVSGTADAVPGGRIKLEGFSTFDGERVITQVAHEVREGWWHTRISY